MFALFYAVLYRYLVKYKGVKLSFGGKRCFREGTEDEREGSGV